MRIAQNYIEQFLDWGFFTSDPHMGNIILRKNNKDGCPESIMEADGKISLLGKAVSTRIELQRTQETNHVDIEITWIDMGMMGKLTSVERESVSQVLASVAKDDAFSLRRALVPLISKKGEVNDSDLLEMLSSVLSKYRTANLADVNVGDVLHRGSRRAAQPESRRHAVDDDARSRADRDRRRASADIALYFHHRNRIESCHERGNETREARFAC